MGFSGVGMGFVWVSTSVRMERTAKAATAPQKAQNIQEQEQTAVRDTPDKRPPCEVLVASQGHTSVSR